MGHIAILRPNLPNFDAIFKYWRWRLKINKLDLIWGPNFIVLRIYFIFGTKFSWNEGIDTCFNVECVLLGRNFGFFGGYFVVNARYLVVTARYLVATARYRSLLLVPTFSMNVLFSIMLNAESENKFLCQLLTFSNKLFLGKTSFWII